MDGLETLLLRVHPVDREVLPTRTARVDADLLLGITAAAMEMYDRIGPEAFASSSSDLDLPAAGH